MAEATATKEENMNDFTAGSIPKKMLHFMLPIFGSLILQAMYGAVDLLVVGQFGTTAGLSGVSTGSNVLNMVTFTITGCAMAVTILIGRYLGEQNPEKISPLIGAAVCLFTVISAILCFVMVVFARPIAVLMQSPKEAIDLTATYIRICGAGIFFIVAYNVIAAIFRGLGDSKTPLLFVFIACLINVVGDLLFVAVFHMNVAGAALATVAAQAVSVVLSIVIMKKKTNLPFHFSIKDIRFNSQIGRILRVGTPLALQEFLTQLSFMCLCAFVNRLGLQASSGYGVASKIVSFVMLIPSSLMQSMSSFISQNVGARREDRAKKAMVFGMLFAFSIGVCIFLFIWFRGYLATGLFTRDSGVIKDGWYYLKGFCGEAIVTPFLFSFMGYFSGHEKSLFVMLQSMAQTFIVRLPVAWYMSSLPHASLTKIGLAAPCATTFGICINLVYFIWFNSQLKKASQK
ncbi:MAG: MATE family efflux transporter [Candidatus Weimeria sp.]